MLQADTYGMTTAIIPSGDSEYVELASGATGKLFRKQILPMNGSFVHPKVKDMKIVVDEAFAKTLVENFNAGRSMVQFPMVNEKNQHVEDPTRNLGEVVDLAYDDTGVYATIDVRKHAEDVGSTIMGASAMLSLDHEDKMTGQKVGPTLLHVAATNRPYLTNLKPYEVVALSDSDTDEDCVVFSAADGSNTEDTMTREELLAALKADHGIDVEALQAAADAAPGADNKQLVAALSEVLTAVNPDMVALSDADEVGIEEVAAGVVELSRDFLNARTQNETLSARVESLESAQAAARVDADLKAGKFLPAQHDAMLELCLTNSDMYDRLIPEDAATVVSLSEDGVTVHEVPGSEAFDAAQAEVNRYLEQSKNI